MLFYSTSLRLLMRCLTLLYGIQGPLLNWIRSFLTNRTQCVVLNGQSSRPSIVLSGVPQGTVLRPLLFLCYINDLPKNVTQKVKLYADDVLLYSSIRTITDCQNLQDDLNRLVQWADRWPKWISILLNVKWLKSLMHSQESNNSKQKSTSNKFNILKEIATYVY